MKGGDSRTLARAHTHNMLRLRLVATRRLPSVARLLASKAKPAAARDTSAAHTASTASSASAAAAAAAALSTQEKALLSFEESARKREELGLQNLVPPKCDCLKVRGAAHRRRARRRRRARAHTQDAALFFVAKDGPTKGEPFWGW